MCRLYKRFRSLPALFAENFWGLRVKVGVFRRRCRIMSVHDMNSAGEAEVLPIVPSESENFNNPWYSAFGSFRCENQNLIHYYPGGGE